jgi:ketosteroid isomerase-like protein
MGTMLRCAALLGAGLGVLAMTGCDKMGTVDRAKEGQALRQFEADWAKELPNKDLAKETARYGPDALLVVPGQPPVKGPDGIGASMAGAWKDPNFSLTFAPDDVTVSKSGDMAYTVGHYTETETDAATKAKATHTGQYITVYTKDDKGAWKAQIDAAFVGPQEPPKAASDAFAKK